MKEIWQVISHYGDVGVQGNIHLVVWPIIRETANYWMVDKGHGWIGRVAKVMVDREVGILGGGKYYSTREKALIAWRDYLTRRYLDFHKMANRCLQMLVNESDNG